jgi:predicted PurR-regulated permease PerM
MESAIAPTTRAAKLSLWVLLLLSAVLLIATVEPLWVPLLLAAVLSGATYRPFDALRRRLGGRARTAAVSMTLGIVAVVLVPLALLTSVVVQQGVAVVQYVSEALAEGGLPELVSRLPDGLERFVRRVGESLSLDEEALREGATTAGAYLADYAGGLLSGGASVAFGLVLTLIAYGAMLLNGPRILGWIESATPLPRDTTRELTRQFRRTSTAVLGSTAASTAAQAVVSFVGYVIAGLPHAVFLGVLTGIVGQIPAVGSSLVTLPVAAWLLLEGDTWQGIFVAIWGMTAVGLADNVVKPLVMRGGMRANGTLVFFALIGGLMAFGPLGLLLGPLALTFFQTMLRFVREGGAGPEDRHTPDASPEARREPSPAEPSAAETAPA